MGKLNEKAERRRQRKEIRRAKNQPWQERLMTAVKNGEIQLSPDPTATASVPIPRPTASAPTTPPTSAPVKRAPQRTERTEIPMTIAGKKEYDAFFRLYDLAIRSTLRCTSLVEALAGKQGGTYFFPAGFIPGPAFLLQFKEGLVKVVEATPDTKKGMKIPTPWQKMEELPARMQEALTEWQVLVQGLGYEPSPWNAGFARRVLEGKLPSKYLAMAMPHFRYRPGDRELPFGVVLVPVEGGMKLERVYNPQGRIPDVPTIGTLFSTAVLKDGKGPVQKLLRTWALMEGNYSSRYGGQNSQSRPH